MESIVTREERNLKIIADDFGLAPPVNEGIFDLLKNNRIDGASLMANGEAFEDAVQKSKLLPEGKIGIHLVLVGEKALLGGDLIRDYKHFFIKYLLGLIKLKDIEAEFRTQIDRAIKAGIKPTFLNSHQHLHLLPAISDIVVKLAQEFNIGYVRTVNETLSQKANLFRKIQLVFLRILSKKLNHKLKKNNLKSNDLFFGFLNAGHLKDSDFKLILHTAQKNPNKTIELNCHPGLESEELKMTYRQWRYNWLSEYKLFKEGIKNKMLYCSSTRLDYSLNSILLKAILIHGVSLKTLFVPRHLKNYLNFIKTIIKTDADCLMIGYDSPLLAIIAGFFYQNKIIFNASLSVHERLIISRELAPRLSLKAFYYWLLDFIAVHFSDMTIVESNSQADYFKTIFKVGRKKILRNWTGVDEDIFFYDLTVQKHKVFTVLFRGALMPESGAEYVVKAAKILEDKNIKFIMIGGGMLIDKIEKLINNLKPKNLEYVKDFLPTAELRESMQKCHLSLGQLSNHDRLTRTIPHKVHESLAMKLPYLTSPNKGVLELLSAGETCLTCDPADPISLAEKVLWARDNYSLVEKIAENGYRLYNDKLRVDILAKDLLIKIGMLS